MSQMAVSSRLGPDAHAHLLNFGLCLFDSGFELVHNVPQAGRPGCGLCEYHQYVVAFHYARQVRCQLSGQMLPEPLVPPGLACGLI